MATELDALLALVPPPDAPPALDVGAFGTALPADHVALLRRYGPGEFLPGLGLHVPGGAPEGGFDLAELAETYAEIHETRASEGPLPAWPAPGGLLAWADDGDAGALHFVTQGPPDRWTVAFVDYEAFRLTPLAGTSTGVLLALHDGTLDLPALAGGELAAERCFVAAADLE